MDPASCNSVSILLYGNESQSANLRFENLKYLANNFNRLDSVINKVDRATICSQDVVGAVTLLVLVLLTCI